MKLQGKVGIGRDEDNSKNRWGGDWGGSSERKGANQWTRGLGDGIEVDGRKKRRGW